METCSDSLSTIIDNTTNERKRITLKNLVCKHGLFYLRFAGLWAEDGTEPSRFSKLRGYFGALVVVAIFGFQFTTLLTEDINGEAIAMFISESLAAKTVICKVLPIILNREKILDTWQKTLQMNSTLRESLIEKEVADRWDRIQCRLIKLLSRFYTAAFIIYQIIPLFSDNRFALKGSYPEWSESGLWFYLIYIVTTVALLIRFLMLAACDICSIIVICRLFSELQRVQHLISELEENDREALRRSVIRHADVLDYGRTICNNFSILFILQHFSMSMSICLLGAVAIYTRKITLLMYLLLFMSSYVTQLSVLCYAGEKLIQESLKISSCIDKSYDKFLNDAPSLKLISMMLMRAQQPLKFNFGSTSLSLSFYTHTLNRIYSAFMILKSMVK